MKFDWKVLKFTGRSYLLKPEGRSRWGTLQLGPDHFNVAIQYANQELLEVRITLWIFDLSFTIWDPRSL